MLFMCAALIIISRLLSFHHEIFALAKFFRHRKVSPVFKVEHVVYLDVLIAVRIGFCYEMFFFPLLQLHIGEVTRLIEVLFCHNVVAHHDLRVLVLVIPEQHFVLAGPLQYLFINTFLIIFRNRLDYSWRFSLLLLDVLIDYIALVSFHVVAVECW